MRELIQERSLIIVTSVGKGSAVVQLSENTREVIQERSPTTVTSVENTFSQAIDSKHMRELIERNHIIVTSVGKGSGMVHL